MKRFMKIAVILFVLSACQFGWGMDQKEEKPLTVEVIMVKNEQILTETLAWVEQHYSTEAPWMNYGDYHSTTSTATHSAQQTTSSDKQKIAVYVATNNDLRDYTRSHDNSTRTAQSITTQPTESRTASTITSFFLPFRSNNLNDSYATFDLGFSYEQPFGERQRRQGAITSETAKSTTAQLTETASVSSPASSSTSSSATSNAPDSIYGKLLLNPSSWGKGTIVFEGRDHRHVHYDNGLDEFTYYSESLQCQNHLNIYYIYNNLPPYYMSARVDDANSSIPHRITGWTVERNDLPQSALHEVSSSSSTSSATTTQPIETVSVTSSSSSEDEEIYGPQTTPTLTKEAQALFSSTLPAIAALAMTAMAMQTKSARN